jgi:hypothetical protein
MPTTGVGGLRNLLPVPPNLQDLIPVRPTRVLPARLTAEQAAWVINCQPADVPILIGARLLKPLGNSLPSNVKFFAASELLEQIDDRTWLAKVTNTLNQHWQKRNAAKRNCPANGSQKCHPSPDSMSMAAGDYKH